MALKDSFKQRFLDFEPSFFFNKSNPMLTSINPSKGPVGGGSVMFLFALHSSQKTKDKSSILGGRSANQVVGYRRNNKSTTNNVE
jgi:hypothetical protein